MDASHLQMIGTVGGLLLGLLIAIFGLLTALANLRKAKFEALKAGVPQPERGLAWPWRRMTGSPTAAPKATTESEISFRDAPEVVVRKRADGSYIAFWQSRSDATKLGYGPKAFPIWTGREPTEADRRMVSETCNNLQTAMIDFLAERRGKHT